jgi:hypothetical protein
VIGAGKRGIVSVIGSNDHQIIIAHCRFNMRHARVEMFESARVAFRVAAVAVEHVEVDQVGKDQTARVLLERMNRLINRLLVVLCR